MGYKSPITIIQERINMDFENGIFEAVQKVNIDVDKEELIKALQYDRNQYDKGYADGKKETAREILKGLEERKERVKAFYGVAESVGVDIAIRTVRELAKQYGVEVE